VEVRELSRSWGKLLELHGHLQKAAYVIGSVAGFTAGFFIFGVAAGVLGAVLVPTAVSRPFRGWDYAGW
jgi:hypothetical protein